MLKKKKKSAFLASLEKKKQKKIGRATLLETSGHCLLEWHLVCLRARLPGPRKPLSLQGLS